MRGGLQALAGGAPETARDRGATGRRLLGELTPFRRELAGALALIVVGAATQAAGPWLISRAIDHDLARRDAGALATTMLLLLGVYVVGALASRAQTYQVGAVGQRVLLGLRARLFDQFQRLPLAYFDRRPVGDLMSRTLSDVETLNQLVSQGLTQLLGALFGLIGILIAMLLLSVPLALASFTLIPAMVLTTALFAGRARAAYRRTRETVGAVTAELQEEIVGVREAQAFNRTGENIGRFEVRNAANRDANVQAVAVTAAFGPSIDVLSTLGTALVIGYGSALVFGGQLSVGLLAAFLIYVGQFFRPLQLAAQVYTQLQSALAGAERSYGILDTARETPDAPTARVLGRAEGRIDFEGVGFAYEAGRPVLSDLTFTALPGQTVALVGTTGAGKTTIASLIPRFYEASVGTVRVDGVDVRDLTRASLRANVGVVLQEPYLFSGTVADNIAYGRPDATREGVEAAAQAVDALDFIRALPQGLGTPLGEGGGNLSQGQRQLLSFARAVVRDPRILILDEATSNIDTRTERAIQRALATLLSGRTSVVIAHRLSTIQAADLILVIDAGRVVERGTHAALLAAGGRYAELSRRQFQGATPSG